MKSLNRIYLVSFLIGGIVTLTLIALGQNAKTSSNISPEPIVNAGMDVTICDNTEFQTNGKSTFKGVTLWKTGGDGIFKYPYGLEPVYLPGEQDLANGEVTLTMLIKPSEDVNYYAKISDSMTLYFEKCKDIVLEQ